METSAPVGGGPLVKLERGRPIRSRYYISSGGCAPGGVHHVLRRCKKKKKIFFFTRAEFGLNSTLPDIRGQATVFRRYGL